MTSRVNNEKADCEGEQWKGWLQGWTMKGISNETLSFEFNIFTFFFQVIWSEQVELLQLFIKGYNIKIYTTYYTKHCKLKSR